MSTLCVAALFVGGAEVPTWLAVFMVGGFVLSLVAGLAVVLWIHRRPSDANVLPLRHRRREQERRPDPRYDPRIFRSKR